MSIDAILVRPHICVWPRKVTDKAKTKEVLDAEGAAKDAGEWKKNLLPRSGFTDDEAKENLIYKLEFIGAKARSLHYDLTREWESPWAVLPVANEPRYRDAMGTMRQAFDGLKAILPMWWDSYVSTARTSQNGMFRAEDYPPLDKIVDKYSFTVDFAPYPTVDHFVNSLTESSRSELVRQYQEREQQLLTAGNVGLRDRIMEPLRTLVERLQSPEGRKFGPLIASLGTLVGNVRTLNITGDADIASLCDVTGGLVSQLDSEVIKDKTIAGQVGEVAQSIVARFGQMGQRKFA